MKTTATALALLLLLLAAPAIAGDEGASPAASALSSGGDLLCGEPLRLAQGNAYEFRQCQRKCQLEGRQCDQTCKHEAERARERAQRRHTQRLEENQADSDAGVGGALAHVSEQNAELSQELTAIAQERRRCNERCVSEFELCKQRCH